MSRNPQLEAIFAARYALESASDNERIGRERGYLKLLDDAISRSGQPTLTRDEVEDAFDEAYRDFRRAKRQDERAKLSRLR